MAAATITTTTTIFSAAEPVQVGVPVVLNASVSGSAPTGTVTFKDGTTTLGTGTLSGTGDTRTATYNAIFTTVAAHSLAAVYAGDTVNKTSTSAALTQTVNKAYTTAAVSSGLNPSTVGTSVTFTATVVGYTPTGTVTFMDGATSLGTATLSGTGNTRTATKAVTTLALGSHNITVVYAGDTKNNTSTSPNTVLSQMVNIRPTTLVLTSSVNPSMFGGSTTFTATITGGSSPTGTVTFYDGAADLGSSTVASAKATKAITILAVGSHNITAVYSGDTNNASSTGAVLSQTVNTKNTTLVTTTSANPSTQGIVTLTGTISGGVTPTGTITFYDGAAVLGSGAVASAKATLALSATNALSAGSHNITTVYTGDTNNATSTSPVLIQTVKTNATIALATSGTPSVFDGSVTLTATVTGNTPSGLVTFKNGSAVLGTGTIAGGIATFTTSTLPVGTRSLTAVYAGDTLNNTVTSSVLNQVVTKVTSQPVLSSSANPAVLGVSTTLTATVTGSNPTGTVTFKDGSATVGTGTLASGVATLTTSTLSLGSHSLTAVYAGDANYATSISSVLTQVVNLQTTSTTVISNANPGIAGAAVTFSATVSGSSPTGTVTFNDGATPLGTGTLSGGVATYTTSALSAGSHSITAQYAGDANNQASTSGAFTQNITAPVGPLSYQYGYDAMGRRHTVIDPNGLGTYTYYDSLGRPIQTQQPANVGASTPTVTNLGYDLGDNLTSVTDPRSLTTTYSPNGLGNVTSQSSPDRGTSGYTYDAKGNILTKTDARGKVTSYTYDALDRLTSITYPTGTPSTLEYDGGATPTPAASGELTKITDESGSIVFGYDSAGRLITKTQTTNGRVFPVTYTWGDSGSALDKLIAITYPSGNRVNYSYDQYGAVSAITVSPVGASGTGFGANTALLSGLSYNADMNVTGWSWSDGTPKTIGYNNYGAVSSYSLGKTNGAGASAGTQRTLSRDSGARITGYSHTNAGNPAPGLDQYFAYDNLGRLLTATLSNASTQYSFDANGNRTGKTINGTNYAITVSPSSNRLVQVQDVGGTYAIGYDAAGNVTSDGVNTFTYSDRGRLASAANAGGTVLYRYNAQELRVYKSGPTALVPTGAAHYVYDEQGQLLGEYDANGIPIYETVYLGAMPVGVMKQTGTAGQGNLATAVYSIQSDHLNTPRLITRQSDQAIVWRWDSAESYGGSAPEQNPNGLGAFVYNQRLPGQVFDAETGLFQNWNREYNPRIGRYIESDPIGLNGGINTFAYVSGNPLSKTDPMGLLEHFMMELNSKPTSTLECGCGDSYPAFSGNPPYRNDPNSTTRPGIGAAPEGWYYIVDRPMGGIGGRISSFITGKDEWFALYRDDGSPGDDTTVNGVTRREIRLHPKGPMGNSFGCVTLSNHADYDKLRKKLLGTTPGIIPGTNIKYYGTILLYQPGVGGLW